MSGFHAHAELRRDPTRTLTLRRRFAEEARGRFNRVLRLVRESLVANDALGLATNEALPSGRFEFSVDAEKIAGFRTWLREQLRAEVLSAPPDAIPDVEEHWMGTHLRRAYGRGIGRAQAEMRRRGVDFEQTSGEAAGEVRAIDRPIHAQRVSAIYTRAFNELQGITDATSQQITRELTDGMARGLHPREIARNMAGRISAVGRHRATLLARTEVIRAHHVATIEEYRRAGIAGVQVKAEFSTAGDSRVCEECAGLEGRVYDLEQIEGMIPVHPQCRCVALPVVEEVD